MAAVHATVTHISEFAGRSSALVDERQEGGDRRPPQFRIQCVCALNLQNAGSGRNLTANEMRT
jgi:hypothetical protein